MAPKTSKADKKIAYDHKLCQLLDEYTQVLVAVADNVGSNQLQNIRRGLRGDSVVLMGKNTMMKRSIRIHAENTGNKAILNLIPLLVVSLRFISFIVPFFFFFCFRGLFCLSVFAVIMVLVCEEKVHVFIEQGNVGLIFTKGDLKEVSEEVAKYKVIGFICLHPLMLNMA